LVGNPHIDAVFAYDKGKHLANWRERLAALWRRVGMFRALRRRRLDLAIVATSGYQPSAWRAAALCAPRRILGFSGEGVRRTPELYAPPGKHEVETVFALAQALGIEGPPPAMVLAPDAAEVAAAARALPPGNGPLLGLHISARRPLQRWPVERFAALARQLHADFGARFLLFWAPGAADDPRHPGDDAQAADLARQLAGLPCAAMPTRRLAELIAGLSLCDRVICSDGGAMHVAAALGKPILCFFGDSDVAHWRPWAVPHVVLQADDVADITVAEAAQGYASLSALPDPQD
jgi:ADP-heptose:LPS heptosyltransferase